IAAIGLPVAQEAPCVGTLPMECDLECADAPPAGCNAEAKDPLCRFCGFDGFRDCKGNGPCCCTDCDENCKSTTTQSTTRTSTTSQSTESTTTIYSSTSQSHTTSGSGGDGTGGPISGGPDCSNVIAAPGELVFEENWEYLNMDIWEHEMTMGGGGNWEFQTYLNNRTNSYVKDNTLYIAPTFLADVEGEEFLWTGNQDLWGASPADQCTGNAWWGCQRQGTNPNYLNPINSARLRTVRSINLQYARIEIEAQLPRGDWLWPAIWMMPKHLSYGKWPASGEIDIMESRGNDRITDPRNGEEVGNNCFGTTLHWGPNWNKNGFPKTHENHCYSPGHLTNQMHTYTIDWTSEYIAWEFDGQEVYRVDTNGYNGFWQMGDWDTSDPGMSNPWENGTRNKKMAPFDTEFYLIFNLAVGGVNEYWSDQFIYENPKPWTSQSTQAMKDFWDKKNTWQHTWNGEDAAMKIGRIRMWQRGDGTEELQEKFNYRSDSSTKIHPMFKFKN
ncbi:unnamed protein product, partial [Oikopleura dioica]